MLFRSYKSFINFIFIDSFRDSFHNNLWPIINKRDTTIVITIWWISLFICRNKRRVIPWCRDNSFQILLLSLFFFFVTFKTRWYITIIFTRFFWIIFIRNQSFEGLIINFCVFFFYTFPFFPTIIFKSWWTSIFNPT